jgi:hypothetical protein
MALLRHVESSISTTIFWLAWPVTGGLHLLPAADCVAVYLGHGRGSFHPHDSRACSAE